MASSVGSSGSLVSATSACSLSSSQASSSTATPTPTSFWYTNKPVEIMREAPDDSSKVVSETFYGEEIGPIPEQEEKGSIPKGWVHIQTLTDKYAGWVHEDAVCKRTTAYPAKDDTVARVDSMRAFLYDHDDTEWGPVLELPFGVTLKVKDQSHKRWIKVVLLDGKELFVQRGNIKVAAEKITKSSIVAFSKRFADTESKIPYKFGGRSSFGYDCSGFCQMLCREMGILIPRDSKDQMAWSGFDSVEMNALEMGDFIFWGRAANRIGHVGMYIGDGQIVHSTVREQTPWARISNLSDTEWNGTGDFVFRAARRLKA